MSIATLGWIPGGLAVILMVYAIFITVKASMKLAGNLKQGILFLMSALVVYLLMGINVGIFSVAGIDFNSIYWLLLPTEALIGAILFLIGAKKMFSTLTEVREVK